MRFTISCIGRMKAGAERDLLDRYIDRTRKIGRNLGVTDVTLTEFTESRARRDVERKQEEGSLLLNSLPPGAKLIVLDERGKSLSSVVFSQKLEMWKDESVPEIVFAIGGADGHGDNLAGRADLKIAFGAMTWPHQLVRILAAEQIYRALTIQAGHPYHRA